MRDVAERFWAKVNKTDSCWLWTAATFRRGYGQFTIRHDQKVSAHRWAYENLVGPIPDGLVLDHLCRTPACVNPAHLEPVTHQENVQRGDSWATFGARTHCPAGHEYSGSNLYVNPNGRRKCRACARTYSANYKRRKLASTGTGV